MVAGVPENVHDHALHESNNSTHAHSTTKTHIHDHVGIGVPVESHRSNSIGTPVGLPVPVRDLTITHLLGAQMSLDLGDLDAAPPLGLHGHAHQSPKVAIADSDPLPWAPGALRVNQTPGANGRLRKHLSSLEELAEPPANIGGVRGNMAWPRGRNSHESPQSLGPGGRGTMTTKPGPSLIRARSNRVHEVSNLSLLKLLHVHVPLRANHAGDSNGETRFRWPLHSAIRVEVGLLRRPLLLTLHLPSHFRGKGATNGGKDSLTSDLSVFEAREQVPDVW
eukprot:15438081-Alexandrium_andersonii.AAC.1